MNKQKVSPSEPKQEQQYNSNVNPFEDNFEDSDAQQKKTRHKRLRKEKKQHKQKKIKKEKKKNKKKVQVDYQDQSEDERNSMFDDEAQSGEEDNDDQQFEAELGYQEQRQRYEQLYKRPNATEQLLERFQGKNQRQINAQYLKKAYAIRQEQQLIPGENDPKLFAVEVQLKTEDQMVLKILNKARYLIESSKPVSIVSALSFKKRYPGKIFVEAYSEREVRQYLDGFINIYLGKKIMKLKNQQYAILFAKRQQYKIDIQENSFVRIRKGLYQGDLAKVFRVKKSSVDVLIVPRINIQDIKMKIRNQTQKLTEQSQINAKKQQILKLLTDHRQKNYKQRPLKRQLYQEDYTELKDIPGIRNIKMANSNGLIILNYRPEDLQKAQGSYLPVEVMPFTGEGKFIDQLKEDLNSYATCVNFRKGEQVQIIAGDLQKHYGILIDIKGSVGVIKCKNKQMKGQILEEPLIFVAKRFKVGQKVKINSGMEKGKVGIILTLFTKQVQVWTQNENSMKVSKRILQACNNETICAQNINSLNKNDLIKTNKNIVGIVLETTKDTIKILDTNNVIQVINNIDFDSKITTKHLVAKNIIGDQIQTGSNVLIKNGVNKDKKGRVVHVYRQTIFIFNQNFSRTYGVCAQLAENCQLVGKNASGKIIFSTKAAGSAVNDDFEEEEIRLGQVITLKTGALKGYQGIVKSITKQKFQVRIPSKSMTEWIPRKTASKKTDQNEEGSKTPSRIFGSMRAYPDTTFQVMED